MGPTQPGHHQGDMKAAQGPVTALLSLRGVSSPLSSWLQGDQPCGDKIPLKPREQHTTKSRKDKSRPQGFNSEHGRYKKGSPV